MPVVTLTTEWRPDDFYHGIIKGKLCGMCPGITIIDNAAGIPPFNISHASFVIRNTYNNYPKAPFTSYAFILKRLRIRIT
jgi:S-adenosylmethionine hydrolase